ncbi:MAG: sulfate permease [Rhizobiales bacterium]|nr:sulfate permease [Hyphomicrobiales bacterium]MBO6698793.1 sulfate permease [Hyphomicrobiales bacterium]MBO6734954.1 sulfate permease [Hyphomicrobiales bacterium]MBO6911240.1 sulfate permease [Hyphomicrobiales bacterium]MBO6955756.1 sulfate permease [Hyphomicrobiales bacterium]
MSPPTSHGRLPHVFPILAWGRAYNREALIGDGIAAVVVTIMLIPQSLAYALLAGVPAEIGLYASMLPLVAYALFGSSRTLSVGPVAIVSLMTAAALAQLNLQSTTEIVAAAAVLALLSGVILLAMGALRLGFVANFLSHPVISGFITASGILIAASQLKHLLGVPISGHTLPEILTALVAAIDQINLPTILIGALATAFLVWVRGGLARVLSGLGVPKGLVGPLVKAGPVFAVIATTWAAWQFDLASLGVSLVGDVPSGLPQLSVPTFNADLWLALLGSAALISLIGFVESVSVAQTLAAKRRQRIDPDQELIGLGASNVASAVSGGIPVTGGFSRSVVNFDAGAQTPAAGALTAIGIGLAALFLTPYLFFLPKATLAATIIVAVLTLVDLTILQRSWRYSRADFAAVAITMALTLVVGVEAGVASGVILSLLLHLLKTSRPHIAEVGLVPGGEHFRNILRHEVETDPQVLSLRIDESLYFANARMMEDHIYARVADDPDVRHLILMFSAVNEVDLSALESLETINDRLRDMEITLHLSEVKGPVMDRLRRSAFLDHLTGRIFLSQYEAFQTLRQVQPPAERTAA